MATYVSCGRCGNLLGAVTTSAEAAAKNAEHIKECAVDFWSS